MDFPTHFFFFFFKFHPIVLADAKRCIFRTNSDIDDCNFRIIKAAGFWRLLNAQEVRKNVNTTF